MQFLVVFHSTKTVGSQEQYFSVCALNEQKYALVCAHSGFGSTPDGENLRRGSIFAGLCYVISAN